MNCKCLINIMLNVKRIYCLFKVIIIDKSNRFRQSLDAESFMIVICWRGERWRDSAGVCSKYGSITSLSLLVRARDLVYCSNYYRLVYCELLLPGEKCYFIRICMRTAATNNYVHRPEVCCCNDSFLEHTAKSITLISYFFQVSDTSSWKLQGRYST